MVQPPPLRLVALRLGVTVGVAVVGVGVVVAGVAVGLLGG